MSAEIREVQERRGGHTLLVGAGESPRIVLFYERCGVVCFHRIKDFFAEHYGRPIVEDGVLLRDMVYFRRSLEGGAAKEKSRRKNFFACSFCAKAS